MNVFSRIAVVACGALLFAACDSDNDNNNNNAPEVETFKLQVLHGSPDAPAVNVSVNNQQVLENLDYKQGSGRFTLEAGTYPVQVDGIVPGGSATVIGPADLPFAGDTIYTVVAVNSVDAIEPVILSQPDTPVSAGSVRLFVLHGAALAPAVDVYVTAPGADLAASAPVGSFEFKGTLGPVEVVAGDYQIRVTAAGDAGAVVYDSGTVALADGSDLVIAALPNTSGGAAPISLVALTGMDSFELLDVDTPTSLQVVHASPDAPVVDVVVNGDTLVPDLPFGTATGLVEVPADTYTVQVQAADNPGVVAIGPVDLQLDAGVRYSILAVDFLANIEPLILTDDPRRVATAAKVRLVHASPTAPNVDIYVTAVGADIGAETPAFSDIPFKANTGYVQLAAGDYDITITATGTSDPAIGPLSVSVEAGGLYTAIARDPLPGSTELSVIVSDDFAD